MIKRGLKQSNCIVIDEEGYTIEHLEQLVKFSIKEGKQIKEVWILKPSGELAKIKF